METEPRTRIAPVDFAQQCIAMGAPRIFLYVDGDPDSVQAVAGAWRQLDITDGLQIVPDPLKALGLLEQQSVAGVTPSAAIAGVILDPVWTGELTSRLIEASTLAQTPGGIPVVIYTADTDAATRIDGVDGRVQKPVVLHLTRALGTLCHLETGPWRPYFGSGLPFGPK